MRTPVFGRMVVHKRTKERINERETYILVELSCANEGNRSMRTIIFVELSCTKERTSERGPYLLVEWSFAKEKMN